MLEPRQEILCEDTTSEAKGTDTGKPSGERGTERAGGRPKLVRSGPRTGYGYGQGHSSWGPDDEWRRPYGLRSIETHPWRGPPRPYETTARYVLPSPDNVPVQPSRLLRGTSHRKASLVEYPAFEPLDLAQPIALFRLWRERRVGGPRYGNHTRNGLRYMLLEVSALGARDRLSTSHYRGRSRASKPESVRRRVARCSFRNVGSGGWRSVDSA